VTQATTIVWFRHDLRLADNPALHAAVQRSQAVVALYIHTPDEEAPWQPGGASRWWLHQSLKALSQRLRAIGAPLVIRRGPALAALRDIAAEVEATAVFWNRRYEPSVVVRDQHLKQALRQDGLLVQSFNAALWHEPWTLQNQSKKPFQVFTPFWKHSLAQPDPAPPLPAPHSLGAPANQPPSLTLADLALEPKINWSGGLRAAWQPGEAGAQAQLRQFLDTALEGYAEQRDYPATPGTSRLSAHLHFGEISPRQIWHGLQQLAQANGWPSEHWRTSAFLRELGWREFAHHLLFHFPHTPSAPLRAEFQAFTWQHNPAHLRAWQTGHTGFPIVDAGMRQLWASGWMHNRVRMIAASFLVKDLLLPWQTGARWFWDTLVDADLAQNTLGWQWTAGCGADAAPYFRVFNPTRQGEQFDPQGHYVRRWCPELTPLPNAWLHQPGAAPADVLRTAGITLGQNYPHPIVNHAQARIRALAAFAEIKNTRGEQAG
jgi:deoxyribodipyrimidine photo-lyase